MSVAARLALKGLVGAPARTATRVLVLAAAVGLLGSMLLFIGYSLRTQTGSAIRAVPLHLQGPVGSHGAALRVADSVARQPGVLAASPAATATFSGVTHRGPAGLTAAGAGALLAVPRSYATHFDVFRFLQGSLRDGAIVLDQ